MCLKTQFTHTYSHMPVHTLLKDVGTWSYSSDSVVHVHRHKNKMYMHMQRKMCLKKQFTCAANQFGQNMG